MEMLVKQPRRLDTSYRVLKVLMLLSEKPRSMSELCYKLDTDGQGVNKETVSKYFATLRHFGCTMEKSGGKFRLKYTPFLSKFDEKELETLAVFQKFGEKLYPEAGQEKLQSALGKILKFESPSGLEFYSRMLSGITIKDIYAKYTGKMEEISKFFGTGARILYQDKWLRISPKHFKYSKNHVYLYAFNEEKKVNALFFLDYIKEIVHLAKTPTTDFFTGITTFKISGRLAAGYHLYEGESVIDFGEDYKIISNKSHDKRELMKRFLKYGESCEVLLPSEERKEFISTLDAMIANYS